MIAAAEVARVKETDLLTLVRSRGIELRRKGSSWQGRCPFHDDGKTPSLSVRPDRNLWKCFGCGKGGDAITFVELHDKLGFRDAVIKLGARGDVAPLRRAAPKKNGADKEGAPAVAVAVAAPPAVPERTPAQGKLLGRVVDYYRRAFAEDPRGVEYLRSRGIKNESTYEAFRVGLANGRLREAAHETATVDDLRALGILNAAGAELFMGCIVVPLIDEQGAPSGLYGRRIIDGEPRHLYLPGPRRGLCVPQAARTCKELVVAESVLDAMALWDAGYPNVLAAYGVTGWTEAHRELVRREQVRELYIAFDGDQAGRDGAERLASELRRAGLRMVIVQLPENRDANDVVRDGGAEAMEALLRAADPTVAERPSFPFHRAQHGYEETASGFKLNLGGRLYEVKGIVRSPTRLRCAVRAQAGARFHIDTLDLYAAKSRAAWVRACAPLFAVEAGVVEQDLRRLMEYAEAEGAAGDAGGAAEAASVLPTADEEAEAMAFLRRPDLLDEVVRDLERVGYAGEDGNKLLGYLAATSRKLDEPLSLLIQSRSAAGKSFLADCLIRLLPPEDVRRYTRVTGQALYYLEEDGLSHKVLSIEEAAGAEAAAYSIRALQSAKSLSVAVTTKDPQTGRMRTDEYQVKGPVAFLLTTCSSDVDPETLSRFLVLTVDESESMTARIHALQREARTAEGLRQHHQADAVVRRHQVAQRLLRPMPIVIPYAPLLRFPQKPLRTRRDHRKYLALIEAVAFLHQHQRPPRETVVDGETVVYVEASLSDLAAANRLARVVLQRTLDELSAPARTLLGEIKQLCEEQAQGEVKPEYVFGRRDLKEKSGWSTWQLRLHLGELEQQECVEAIAGSQGKQYVYRLHVDEEGKPLDLDLSDPAEVARRARELGIEVVT